MRVSPKTAGGRDSIYRAGLEAAAKAAQKSNTSSIGACPEWGLDGGHHDGRACLPACAFAKAM